VRLLDAALQHGGWTTDLTIRNTARVFFYEFRKANLKSGVKPPQSKNGGVTARMIHAVWGEGFH
jgi:hypothetical protein